MITPPPGYHFDPFADARMGLSLFQMTPDDWLVRDRVGAESPAKPSPTPPPTKDKDDG